MAIKFREFSLSAFVVTKHLNHDICWVKMEEYAVAAYILSSEWHYREKIRLERLRDVSNPFELAEAKFRKLFRIPKSGALQLINSLKSRHLTQGEIPKHLKILCALQFMAQGSYQAAVGQDSFLSVSQPTVSRCLTITAKAIVCELTPKEIKFPITSLEKEAAKAGFQSMFGMPNTLGAIDGTHIAISKPPLNHPTAPGSLFYNRKGFYSINCQIICSAKGKIIGLNPNFPGSTHDAAIWRASTIHRHLRHEFLGGERQQWLLGDKGYPLQPWLLTPTEPTTINAQAYNERHARARNVVEMCNGRLKNKFRCLHKHRCLHYKPEKAAMIILACCTLYNMFLVGEEIDSDDEMMPEEEFSYHPEDPFDETDDTDFLAEARVIRDNLINSLN